MRSSLPHPPPPVSLVTCTSTRWLPRVQASSCTGPRCVLLASLSHFGAAMKCRRPDCVLASTSSRKNNTTCAQAIRKYQFEVITSWPGGVYATPSMAGSRCVAIRLLLTCDQPLLLACRVVRERSSPAHMRRSSTSASTATRRSAPRLSARRRSSSAASAPTSPSCTCSATRS